MSTEKINATSAIDDKDLEKVAGGANWVHFTQTDKYFKWTGSDFTRNGKYLCPRCKRPVHYGGGCRFYCDPCDCSWWDENLLLPDPSSGNWKEITAEEYGGREYGMMFG